MLQLKRTTKNFPIILFISAASILRILVICFSLFCIISLGGCSGTKTHSSTHVFSTPEELSVFNKGKYYKSQASSDSNGLSVKQNLDSAVYCFETLADLKQLRSLTEERRYSILYLSDIYSTPNYNNGNYDALYSIYKTVGRLYPNDKILQDWLSQGLSSKYKSEEFIETHSWLLDSLLFVHSPWKKFMKERYLLETIYDSDQKYRRILYFNAEQLNSTRKKNLWDSIDVIDKQNLLITEKILSEKG